MSKEEFIRDRLVIGMRDKETSEMLQTGTGSHTGERRFQEARHSEILKVQNASRMQDDEQRTESAP